MTTHLEQTLQRDIERIRGKVAQMAALDEQALEACLRALGERNRRLAYSVILRDQRIDELENEIDRLCLEFLVRQQPVAKPLRFAYVTIKINLELERVGDYAESMARQILALADMEFPLPHERLAEIGNLAIPMLRAAAQAYQREDVDLARRTMEGEDAVDRLRHELNTELVRMLHDGRIPPESLTPLMAIGNRFERVADQAKSLCQNVVYLCTGEYAVHKGTDVYRVLFVDERNSCRSQMAEAIGTALGEPHFVFASAGLDPAESVDSAAAFFLERKGATMSRAKPRAVSQIPHVDQYQVVVALAEAARKVFPPPPHKTVCLDWSVRDPSRVTGDAEAMNAAYGETYEFLSAHIKDLVEAILGDRIT